MRLPSPRGFPAQSHGEQICQHAQMFDRRRFRHEPELIEKDPTVRPAKYLAALAAQAARLNRQPSHLSPSATVALSVEERKLFIPTGKRTVRKRDGKPGAEEKIPVILVTTIATVTHGKGSFYFRVTNRSRSVLDSRAMPRGLQEQLDWKAARIAELGDSEPTSSDRDRFAAITAALAAVPRKPLAEVFSELLRLCPPDQAQSAADTLAAGMATERTAKPKPAPVPEPPVKSDMPNRVRWSARKHLLRHDPVIEYLSRPITPMPEFLS